MIIRFLIFIPRCGGALLSRDEAGVEGAAPDGAAATAPVGSAAPVGSTAPVGVRGGGLAGRAAAVGMIQCACHLKHGTHD